MNWVLLFWLLVGHALADFALQSDAMVKGKNRHRRSEPPPGAQYIACWSYWLSAHALIHGGMVALITSSVPLGMCEFVAHWTLDFLKCDKWTDVHTDQFFHIAIKVGFSLTWLSASL